MEFTIETKKREEIVDITQEIQKVVDKLFEKDKKLVCNKKPRACLIYVPHTTCSVTINENYDSDVKEDILSYLRKNIPINGWKHEEGNSDAHIKASLIGNSVVVPLIDGKLGLGRWQGIGFAEFDGARERKVVVEILS